MLAPEYKIYWSHFERSLNHITNIYSVFVCLCFFFGVVLFSRNVTLGVYFTPCVSQSYRLVFTTCGFSENRSKITVWVPFIHHSSSKKTFGSLHQRQLSYSFSMVAPAIEFITLYKCFSVQYHHGVILRNVECYIQQWFWRTGNYVILLKILRSCLYNQSYGWHKWNTILPLATI